MRLRVTSPYGYRTHPVTGEHRSFHHGIDLGLPRGAPIYAVTDARVSRVRRDGEPGAEATGNAVTITRDGWSFCYLHLAVPPYVGVGRQVQAGQVIGIVGDTGRATGPHLHFGVFRPDGSSVDPAALFPRGTFNYAR